MSAVVNIRRLTIASDLVRSGLRLSIIVALTGLTPRPLRKMWLEIHGKGPPNGKLPESVVSFAKNYTLAANISAFVSVYISRNVNLRSHISPVDLLKTWRIFEEMGTPLNINAAYYGLRDVRAAFVSFPKCNKCGARYIFDTGSAVTSRCPFCLHNPMVFYHAP